MAYNIDITSSTLTSAELYEGRVVYFNTNPTVPDTDSNDNDTDTDTDTDSNDTDIDPNDVGILELSRNVPGADGVWTAVINGIRYNFNANGAQVKAGVHSNTPVLYGVVNFSSIDPTIHNSTTRGGGQGESNTVSISYMIPKDYFACNALNALIQKIDNPLGMSNGTIALLAAKCYKIAEAMAIEAYNSRENDKASPTSGAEYIDVTPESLNNNTDRILYNIGETLKLAMTTIDENDEAVVSAGIKISEIPNIILDNTSQLSIVNTSEDPVIVQNITVTPENSENTENTENTENNTP